MNSGPETLTNEAGEGEVTVVRHWGCQLLREDGTVYTTRWNPGYGSGVYVPYSEAEARQDVAQREANGFSKRLVSRTETTVVVSTQWKVVE